MKVIVDDTVGEALVIVATSPDGTLRRAAQAMVARLPERMPVCLSPDECECPSCKPGHAPYPT